jgi:adenosylcobinamide-GDP ribazoletransferase
MQNLLAAFIFFTRLPFGRWVNIPAAAYKRVVPFWSFTGWLTAGLSVLVLFLSSIILPYSVALLLAIITRLLLTGGLHEDGLADFLDGFDGGTSRERILLIMKDSHIGTYGVIGLIAYFTLFYALLYNLPIELAGFVWLAGDPFAKGLAGQVINRLPYVRKEEEAKSKTVYDKMTSGELLFCLLGALLPLYCLPDMRLLGAVVLPVCLWFYLTTFMKHKIGGYTGDCCGALFLLCELSFYLGVVIVYQNVMV